MFYDGTASNAKDPRWVCLKCDPNWFIKHPPAISVKIDLQQMLIDEYLTEEAKESLKTLEDGTKYYEAEFNIYYFYKDGGIGVVNKKCLDRLN